MTKQQAGFPESLRDYFSSGATRSYDFRKKQLNQLKEAIQSYEERIYEALYADLKKGREESFASEIGLVLSDINYALKHLKKWMKPKKVTTNLVNIFSSSKIYHDPRGVVMVIGAWNYPFLLSIQPVIGAIAAGNCVVLKPSEIAPATSVIIAKMIAEYFNPEYFKVVEGKGEQVIPAMMDDFRFDYIFYTGSTKVGKSIYEAAAKKLIPVTLEMGGKSPAIVEESADIKIAAKRIALGKFLNAGQTCVAPDYILVHHSIKDRLINELSGCIKNFYSEDPQKTESYGKIINESRFDVLESYIKNNEVIFGGDHDKNKLYIEPTIITNINMEDGVMQEEIFGPVLPLIPYQDRKEAHKLISQNPDPLAFYLFTEDSESEKWWMQNVTFGGGCVNNTIWQLSNMHLPFGGVGDSGIGAYHGKYTFLTFTHAKSVMKTPNWFDPDIKYPPFSGKMKWLKLFFR